MEKLKNVQNIQPELKESVNDLYYDNEKDEIDFIEEKETDDVEMKSYGEFPNNLSKNRNEDLSNYRPITFKNYLPIDENFSVDKLPYYDRIEQIEKSYEKKVKKSVKDFLNLEKNPLNVVPKKNNIDLKRNLSKKLEKLKKKTEIAIMEIIRENIEKQKKELEVEEDKTERQSNKKEDYTGNKLLMATNLQMSIEEEALRKEYFDEEDQGDISSDYDKGINDK